MKALHFGAGNIGKGFIGNLLSKAGYGVCFIDVNQLMIDHFNKRKSYQVELLDDSHTVETIRPVRALNSITQEDKVIEEIVNADLITTSVGVGNLPKIASTIAKGLIKRVQENKRELDILANENAINASSILKKEIQSYVTKSEMDEICSYVGFPNTAIDRLALSKQGEDGEIALVEPFYEWVINKSEMVNQSLPLIENAVYVENLKPYIERKLYMVNMAHATTAYIGFLTGKHTIQSALENSTIEDFVRSTLIEASPYIIQTFHITEKDINDYIENIIKRFRNKNISDRVIRVGRSPIRKLGFNERLVKPTRELFKLGCPIDYLTKAIAAAFLFDHPGDQESVQMQKFINEKGIEQAILHFTKIEHEEIKNKIKRHYLLLKSNSNELFI
ncbi:mannitol-1-phosphate 5-dehydrogenase [Niallia alba]|uniref:mannitol-1-phosphate 5-dehydrogenase n=1 Tax=Niallia alba TaxID=2729105 RepID=UPI00399F3626